MTKMITKIDCPSCSRSIDITLHPPTATDPNECIHDHYNRVKVYSLHDLLYVHEELIKQHNEWKLLIRKYENIMGRM